MIKKLPARKVGMTSAFDGAGTTVPVTLVQPFDVTVTEIKRLESHGYSSIQVAYQETLAKRLTKPHKGVLAKAGIEKNLRKFYESRVAADELEDLTVGQVITAAELLPTWGVVKVTATSKGKGFAGVMKRWGFKGQCRTHGDPDNRRPMSNNATDPARVFKGSRRPGRMGGKQISVKGVSVFEYDSELNILVLAGSIPGPNGATVYLTMAGEKAQIETAPGEGENRG